MGSIRNKTLAVCIILILCLTFVFIACDKEEEKEESFTVYAMAGAEKVETKKYSATVALEDSSLKFANIEKKNYVLEVMDANTLEVVRSIDEFTITQESDFEIDVTFTDSDYISENNYWRLSSKSAVISDGSPFECSIYLSSTSYGLVSDVSTINRYDQEFTLTMSLVSGTLVDTITKDMISVSGALYEKDYTLTRVNSTTFSMTYENAFDDDVANLDETNITLLSSAILDNMKKDVDISFSIIAPTATIDTSAMQFISTPSNTKVVVPIVVEDGLLKTVNKSDVTITNVENFSVDSVDFVTDNVMIVTLSTTLIDDEAIAALDSGVITIAASAVNMGGKADNIAFGSLKSAISITAESNLSSGSFSGYVLSIRTINGSFADYESITKADISIKDKNDNDYDFTIKSKSENLIVATIATSATTLAGSVSIDSSLINSRFGLIDSTLSGVFQTSHVKDSKEFKEFAIDLIKKGATSVVTSAASAAGSKLITVLTPYVFDYLGIKQELSLEDINSNINSLGVQLNDLSAQVTASTSTILNAIEKTEYKMIFNDYNKYYNTVSYYVLDAYGNTNGLAKLLKLEKSIADSNGNISDSDFANLELNAEYAAAKAVFIDEYERMGVSFATDVNTFGMNLMSKTYGEKDGYLYSLWGFLKDKYLWDIQTIEVKDSFMKSAASVYFLGMAATMRYLGYKNSANRANYALNFKNVAETIDTYQNDLNASMQRRRTARTLEYTTGKVVQLAMGKYDPQKYRDDKDSNLFKDVTVSLKTSVNRINVEPSALNADDLKKIIASANAKGIDFFKSLKEAKFTNLPKENSMVISVDRSSSQTTIYREVVSLRGKLYVSHKISNGAMYTYTAHYVTITGNSVSGVSTRAYATETTTMSLSIRTLNYKNTNCSYYFFQW